MGVIPTDTTRDIGRIGRLIGDLNERLDKVMPILGALGRGVIDSAGLQILDGGTLSVSGAGRIVLFGVGKIGTMVSGAFGMATDDGLGNLTFPKTQMNTDGFLADNGNGYVVVGVNTDGSGKLASSINLWKIAHTTSSSAANARLELDGSLYRSVSGLRYKQDIADGLVDLAAFLKLRVRTWRDRGEVERDPDTTRRHIGFIAEEVHALGLTQFVTYDDDGNAESLDYDRLTAGLIMLAQAQQKTLDDYAVRLQALENPGGLNVSIKTGK